MSTTDLDSSYPSFADDHDALDPHASEETSLPDELSEQQLRELYDNEEIDRFLHLFSAYIHEVQRPDSPASDLASEPLHSTSERSLAESIALGFILPRLPPPPIQPPVFTLGRLRLATQRFYLSTWPIYGPFFRSMIRLSTWENWSTSAVYCTVFWILWYYNLLLPSLFLRIFHSLLRRRIFPYPTPSDLRRRRREVVRADELGNEVSERLSSSSFGAKELWRIFRILNKPKAIKKAVKEASSSKLDSAHEEATVLDDATENTKETDIKRAGLLALNETADLHERLRNIFIWRKPEASRIYGAAILFCFAFTLIVPARYVAKSVYFIGGLLFWHIVPVIVAIPPEERRRLPPAFADVPTDADYAMEVISQRIAVGLDVNPSRTRRRAANNQGVRASTTEGTSLPQAEKCLPIPANKEKDRDIDWKKWGERAAIGKAWAVDKRLFGSSTASSSSPASPIVPQPALPVGIPQSSVVVHTFPCQHTSAPGLITLTSTTFFFTPITSSKPTLTIPCTYIKGVKKTGLLKGLTLKWRDSEEGSTGREKQEVFNWVGGRDEIFARLIGTDVKRWMKA